MHDYRVITVDQTGDTFPTGAFVIDFFPHRRIVAWWKFRAQAYDHVGRLHEYDADFAAEVRSSSLRMELESEPELMRHIARYLDRS